MARWWRDARAEAAPSPRAPRCRRPRSGWYGTGQAAEEGIARAAGGGGGAACGRQGSNWARG
uniref:Uncharacterized protein n=1 Tax=Oryza glumipatula TaxID=40148 RepID=A0A0E0ALG1_9ORYZ